MGITKDGNTIHYSFEGGDPKGDSAENPWELSDILDASDSGSWSPAVTVQGTDFKQYYIPYKIVGDSGYLRIRNESLSIETDEAYAIYARSGILVADSTTHNNIITTNYKQISLQEANIEDTLFNRVYRFYVYQNCTFKRCQQTYGQIPYYIRSSGNNVEDWISSDCLYGFLPLEAPSSATRLTAINCTLGFVAAYLYNSPFTVSNLEIINCGTDIRVQPQLSSLEYIFIDSQIDLTSRNVYAGSNGDVTVYNKTTLKINITNGDGGTATLYDTDDNEIASQVLSGEWERVTTFETLYVETSGGATDEETYTDKTPFKLVVTKDGYDDLEIPGITVTAGDITEIFGEMKKKTFYERDIAVAVAEDSVSLQVEEDEVQIEAEEI